MAVARMVLCAHNHSIATEPAPAPMSHKCSPGQGARADSTNARIGDLVSCPSWAKKLSARPVARGMLVPAPRTCNPTASGWRNSAPEISARPRVRTRSCAPPRLSSTLTTLSGKPRVPRYSASAGTDSPPRNSTSRRAP